MMKVLIAILTSEKIDKLGRCVESVLTQIDLANVVIVINTTDSNYASQAQSLADSYGINSVTTESNGKPGKGKNSLLKYFLKTDFTHVIPVDGDDILLPNAVDKLLAIAKDKNPDVLGLIDGLVMLNDETMPVTEWQDHEVLLKRSIDNTDPANLKRLNIHVVKLKRVASEQGNALNRFVLVNRKAASYIRYDESISSGEDVKQGMLLKLMQRDGELDYILLSSQNIYLYDVTNPGACFAACKVDPHIESKLFWAGITVEQINILRSFQLECLRD
jgi:glycosyltransferase involved in cell wall biosynthesis